MFSKKPEHPAPRANLASKPVANNSTFSVIGSDVTIKGDVAATTELHVDGAIQGDISCASIVQGETSTIEGAIEAESARMAGVVKGSISARELVILRSAKIHGDVHYDALTIEQGAEVEGRFAPKKAAGEAPSKSKASNKGGEPALSVAS
ncbi:bactofilin family protein [Pontixanthobacter sp.]|uniref:bactofilin family protein n=1 Tax=Pontixanthobacter sp. TaxID=2792078 RepID=UPI003C7E3F7A